MDEIIDLLDEFGHETNKTISKNEAHKKGLWHKAIHILIINKNKTKTLIQQRCENKKLFPNMWDISVGGHVLEKEDTLTSAKRELQEELGLNPNNYHIQELCTIQESFKEKDIISNEYVTVYLIEADINIKDIILQKEEVSSIKWINKKELNELIHNNQIIPHIKEYEMLNNILIDIK